MPEGTLRTWVVGRNYPAAGQTKNSPPLINLVDPRQKYLSFINLVEAHVLAAIRRRHGVKLPNVRAALDYTRRQFKVEHPLINQAFQTDGLDLFIERYGELINASRAGQQAMKEIIGIYLKRIEWDTKGLPLALYPFTRDTQSEAIPADDPRVVVINPFLEPGLEHYRLVRPPRHCGHRHPGRVHLRALQSRRLSGRPGEGFPPGNRAGRRSDPL